MLRAPRRKFADRATGPKPWRMNSDAYFKLFEAGHFGDAKVELLNGRVVEMASQLDPHMWSVSKATRAALNAYPDDRFSVFTQGTLRLSKWSAPDPDVHVVEAALGTPWDKRPLPLWVLEVSDSTYPQDSGRKLRLYAASGIAEYWILNLSARRLEVHRHPVQSEVNGRKRWTYRDRTHILPGESITPLQGPPVTFAVNDLLPPEAAPSPA